MGRKRRNSDKLKEPTDDKSLEKRVEHLELQIEILTDVFKQHRRPQ